VTHHRSQHRPARRTALRSLAGAALAVAGAALALGGGPAAAQVSTLSDVLGALTGTTTTLGATSSDEASSGLVSLAGPLAAPVCDTVSGVGLDPLAGGIGCTAPTTSPPTTAAPTTATTAPTTTAPRPPASTSPAPTTGVPVPTDPGLPGDGGDGAAGPAPVGSGPSRGGSAPAPDDATAASPTSAAPGRLTGPTARVDADAARISSLDDDRDAVGDAAADRSETETDLVAVRPSGRETDLSDTRRGVGIALLGIGLALVGIGAAGTVRKRLSVATLHPGSDGQRADPWSGTPWEAAGNGPN
jgi:hypothetical protein